MIVMIFKTKLMRILSTLCLLLFSSVCFSQIEDLIRKSEYQNSNDIKIEIIPYLCGFARNFTPIPADLSSLQGNMVRPKDSVLLKDLQIKVPGVYVGTSYYSDTVKKPATKIIIRCGIRNLNETPLIVVDGVPQDSAYLRTLNPNDIESIDILKEAAVLAIYGCRASAGVVLITTKQSKLRKFIIKDFLDGNRIQGATVSFISANKKDTIMIAANDSGMVVTDKLKSSVNYEMSVSAVGYKLFNQAYKNEFPKKEQELMLERETKVCQDVVVSAIGITRICRISCKLVTSIVYVDTKTDDNIKTKVEKVFPNPVQKGKSITIETTTQSEGPIQVRLISLDGKLLLSQPQKAYKGLNRFSINTDPRWAAGICFVQLYANGKLLASDKVVIQ
jgi:TonB-dependent SusC/RagA subfamily outer membrane receptor